VIEEVKVMATRKKNKEIYEDVQIYGPEDIAHLNVEEVIAKVNIDLLENKGTSGIKASTSQFEHYYSENPTSDLRVKEHILKLKNAHQYKFKAPSGVYGKKRIDRASILLIENVKLTNEKVLDIGCGYGVIGITLKKEYPNITLFMSDINSRAVEYSKINAKDNNAQAIVKQGHLFEPWEGELFDVIVCNPPIVAGKAVLHELVNHAKDFLVSNGKLFIVAYHNKGGSSLENYMKEVFGNVIQVTKSGGFRVYLSMKRG